MMLNRLSRAASKTFASTVAAHDQDICAVLWRRPEDTVAALLQRLNHATNPSPVSLSSPALPPLRYYRSVGVNGPRLYCVPASLSHRAA